MPGSTNGASPAVASRPAQTESLAVNLTQQCREIISKLVLVNRKYGLEFTDVHETLMRRHPEQATLIAAIVQAAKGVRYCSVTVHKKSVRREVGQLSGEVR